MSPLEFQSDNKYLTSYDYHMHVLCMHTQHSYLASHKDLTAIFDENEQQ